MENEKTLIRKIQSWFVVEDKKEEKIEVILKQYQVNWDFRQLLWRLWVIAKAERRLHFGLQWLKRGLKASECCNNIDDV